VNDCRIYGSNFALKAVPAAALRSILFSVPFLFSPLLHRARHLPKAPILPVQFPARHRCPPCLPRQLLEAGQPAGLEAAFINGSSDSASRLTSMATVSESALG